MGASGLRILAILSLALGFFLGKKAVLPERPRAFAKKVCS